MQQRRDRRLGRLLRGHLGNTDQVVLTVLARIELMSRRRRQPVPRGVVGEVVVGVGPDERNQVGDRLEAVQIVVLAEERLPFVVGVPPRRSPQGVQIALGQPKPHGHDVSSHGAQPNDAVWGGCRQAVGPMTGPATIR